MLPRLQVQEEEAEGSRTEGCDAGMAGLGVMGSAGMQPVSALAQPGMT